MLNYQEIYDAALNLNEDKVKSFKFFSYFNDKTLSAAGQLAFENKHEAVQLLTKYNNKNLEHAAKGYAMNGNHDKVAECLNSVDCIYYVLCGYAMAGNHKKVNDYFMYGIKNIVNLNNRTLSIEHRIRMDIVASAYAMAGNDEIVKAYYARGTLRSYVAYGYARVGNHEELKKYYQIGVDEYCDRTVVTGYVMAGNHKKIEECYKLGVDPYWISSAYASFGYYDEAKKMLLRIIIQEIKNLKSCNSLMNALFNQNEKIKKLSEFATALISPVNHHQTIRDLLKEYDLVLDIPCFVSKDFQRDLLNCPVHVLPVDEKLTSTQSKQDNHQPKIESILGW